MKKSKLALIVNFRAITFALGCAMLILGAIGLAYWITGSGSSYYADSKLIDATGPIAWEEDGDPAELGKRVITLAAGDARFTQEQLDQIVELFAGLCETVRENGIGIEWLEFQVRRLME